MGITGMNHAVLYVRDARRQQRFYTDVLGFRSIVDEAGAVAVLPLGADVTAILATGRDRPAVQALLARCVDESPPVSAMV